MSNEKPTYSIILDFDDVIYPLCKGIKAVLAEAGVKGEITQWALEADFGMSREEFWGLVYQPEYRDLLYLQPLDFEVLAQIRRLRYAGHRINIVTARQGEHPERYARQVIRQSNVPCDSLTFTEDKGKMIEELDASFSLDDAPHNYEALNQPGHMTFLMDAPHNRSFTTDSNGRHVRRANSVKEFVDAVLSLQRAGVQLRGENASEMVVAA